LASSDPILELRGVDVCYGAFRALENVSYRVGSGEIVCLLGGNASGKSSSMKAIFGTASVTAGHVYWQGECIDKWPTTKRVMAGISAVPEGRRVFAHMSVFENLEIGACNRRDHAEIRSDLEDVFNLFPRLRERQTQLSGTLSGGEQQMLAFGRALMSKPKIICMDEPSMGLAPALVARNFRLIESIRQRGTAVFLVEQNANAALKIADYAYVLRAGQLMLEGTAAQVAADPDMRVAYLGRAGHEVADAADTREPGTS